MKRILLKPGEQFGRWVVVCEGQPTLSGKRTWECQCECGTKKDVMMTHLRSGRTVSCGCYQKELVSTHGMSYSKEYQSWINMLNRCLVSNPQRERYNGRGITVCGRWKSFEKFNYNMGKCPEGYELDRINNNGNYDPSNCRWASEKMSSQNTRRSKTWTVDMVKYNSLSEAEKLSGKSRSTILRHCMSKEYTGTFSELVYA